MAGKVKVKEATGADIRKEDLLHDGRVKKNCRQTTQAQTELQQNDGARQEERQIMLDENSGFGSGNPAVQNTRAINAAIGKLHQEGGGTVVIPAGTFWLYTVELKSNVNLCLSEGTVLQAAKPGQKKEENYLEPEVRGYAGIQDHGHTYFANSFFYAENQENIMIYGKGLLSGSFLNEEGIREFVLRGDDPEVPECRNERGHRGNWFGNKGIAMVNCRKVVLADFSIVIGGHFAIITEGVENLLIDNILVDTNRDALDLDCCQKVTVRNSIFNSLTDDGIVVKASYGAERFYPSANILIEDCTVCGYDAGSVYSKEFTKSKQVADDLCGPTGRVKLGTESTCGYEQVTVRRVKFDRSRGFALEAVDGAPLHDILFEDCVMEHISSSPFFIKAGDRARFPVTGKKKTEEMQFGSCSMEKERGAESRNECRPGGEPTVDVRLDKREFILPDRKGYDHYPAKRFLPSYNRDKKVTVDGKSYFYIVNEKGPARINEANLYRDGEKTYPVKYDEATGEYVPDLDKELKEKREEFYYANASGSEAIAKVSDIVIRNVKATDVDPRYPVLLMGLVDSPIERVSIENVEIHYRGGMKMEQAVEQRQLFSEWEFSQSGTKRAFQKIPWLVNPFFLKNEGLLPRVDYDPQTGGWRDDPYNVPELPEVYPEPSNWGILPAYGIYARHVRELNLENIRFYTGEEEERHVMVLDDVEGVMLSGIAGKKSSLYEKMRQEKIHRTGRGGDNNYNEKGISAKRVVTVTNHFKRTTNHEYIPDEPYRTTAVTKFEIEASRREEWTEDDQIELITEDDVENMEVNAPAPGTPKDSLYQHPTTAIPENGYRFKVRTEDYPYPECVFPDIK